MPKSPDEFIDSLIDQNTAVTEPAIDTDEQDDSSVDETDIKDEKKKDKKDKK